MARDLASSAPLLRAALTRNAARGGSDDLASGGGLGLSEAGGPAEADAVGQHDGGLLVERPLIERRFFFSNLLM